MNREIRFRIWSPKHKIFIEMFPYNLFHEVGLNGMFKQKEYIFQQFTGLKDSAGKDIYEGDIIKLNSESLVQEVKFGKLSDGKDKEGITCFFLDGSRFGNGWVEPRFDSKNYKIIGNIFENPELLKAKKNKYESN